MKDIHRRRDDTREERGRVLPSLNDQGCLLEMTVGRTGTNEVGKATESSRQVCRVPVVATSVMYQRL